MTPINEQHIIKAKLEIQEQVLKNIIKEIHDNIGQILSLAQLHLGTLDVAQPKQVIEKTDYSKQLISKAIMDLRRLAKHLESENISWMGLPKFIEYEMALLPKERIAGTSLRVVGEACTLTGEEELLLFRIVQEIIQLFILSSSTSIIAAEMQYNAEALTITLQNTEKSELPVSNLNENAKLETSMHTVYNRIRLIGASLYVSTILGNQTTAIITLPYSNA